MQDSRREDQVAAVLERAARLNIAVEVLSRRALDSRLPGLRHQGLVACRIPTTWARACAPSGRPARKR